MLLKLSQENQEQLQKLWGKSRKTEPLRLRFDAEIQCVESPASSKAKLKKISRMSALEEAPVPPSEENPALPSEINPLEEDFVNVTYRALSAAVIDDRALDFSDEGMLKRGVPLLQGQTVYKDHETSVDNWVGIVQSTKWDTETPGLPPGINAELRLDSVKDPMIVRGVLQGAVHSASVTVEFQWKPSHPDLMDAGNFWNNLGTEVEGEPVRIVVTEIQRFLEISLVWQGADRYAKQIGSDGEPLNTFSLQLGESKLEETQMKNVLDKLSKLLGDKVNEDNLEQSVLQFTEAKIKATQDLADSRIADLNKNIEKVSSELSELSKKHEEVLKKNQEMAPKAELGENYIAAERAEAERLCKIAKGDSVSEAILETLREASLKVVQAWKVEFQKECDGKFPARCVKCGDTQVTLQSSKTAPEPKSDEKVAEFNPATAERVNNLH